MPQKPIELHYWPTPNGHKITIMLEECGLPYEIKPVNIGKGDQFKPEFLAISPNNRMPAIDEIVQAVRSLRPDLPIVSRARDAAHARHLYAVGVTDAVPETIEASLQLSEAALVGLGLPAGPVIASIHEKRDEFRHELQEAAGQAGQAETRSIRAKTLRRS